MVTAMSSNATHVRSSRVQKEFEVHGNFSEQEILEHMTCRIQAKWGGIMCTGQEVQVLDEQVRDWVARYPGDRFASGKRAGSTIQFLGANNDQEVLAELARRKYRIADFPHFAFFIAKWWSRLEIRMPLVITAPDRGETELLEDALVFRRESATRSCMYTTRGLDEFVAKRAAISNRLDLNINEPPYPLLKWRNVLLLTMPI